MRTILAGLCSVSLITLVLGGCNSEPAASAAAPLTAAASAAPPAPVPVVPAPQPAAGAVACVTTGSKGSCVQTGADTCIDYTGAKWTAETIQKECSSGWVYSAAPCATANTVGICAYSSKDFVGLESSQRHYSNLGMTSAQSAAFCAGNTAMDGVFCAP